MRMQRLATLSVAVLVSVAAFGAGTAAADVFRPYTAPGEWFSPGEMYGSAYDWCGYWKDNTFSKAQSSHGLITYIDTGGNWHFTVQGKGVLSRQLTWSEMRAFTKKLHCRNNSGVGYQGGCFGILQEAYCA